VALHAYKKGNLSSKSGTSQKKMHISSLNGNGQKRVQTPLSRKEVAFLSFSNHLFASDKRCAAISTYQYTLNHRQHKNSPQWFLSLMS